MFAIIALTFVLLLSIKQFITLLNIIYTLDFYKRGLISISSTSPTKPQIIIVIPLLREQTTISDTLSYFTSLSYPKLDIVIITTEKELVEGTTTRTTIDVINSLKSSYDFKWLHFPKSNGTKADQLNYVIDQFDVLFPDYNAQNSVFAFYDVDSRPSPKTFDSVAQLINSYPERNVFQQSSIFFNNFNRLDFNSTSRLSKLFLQTQALRATRFAFGYEVPRIKNQLMYYNKIFSWRSLLGGLTYAHCVGHGLFIRVSFSQKVRFPENSIMEDMFYGFILNYLNEPITPIPVLTNSDVPEDVKILFYQLSRWYLGPSRFFEYFNYTKKKYPSIPRKLRGLLLVFTCIYISLSWALTTPILLFIYISLFLGIFAIFTSSLNIVYLLFFISCLIFIIVDMSSVVFFLNNYPLFLSLANSSSAKERLTIKQKTLLLLTYPLTLIFHSIPAYYCIYDVNFSKGYTKSTKTERQ